MLNGNGDGAVPLKGQTPGQHFIEHHAGGIDIGAGVRPVTAGLLGRDVVHTAQSFLGHGLAVGQACNTEIGHLDAAVPQHHDILRFDVPVDDAAAVGVAESAHDLDDEVQRLPPIHFTTPLHILLEGDAVDELHDDIVQLVTAGHVIHRDDVGVGQLSDSQRLIVEAAAEFRTVRQVAFEDLDGNQTIQPVALGLIDVGHAAPADELQKLVPVIQHFSNILIHSFRSFHKLPGVGQIFISRTAVTLSGAPR